MEHYSIACHTVLLSSNVLNYAILMYWSTMQNSEPVWKNFILAFMVFDAMA